MKIKDRFFWLLVGISAITIISGLAQMIAPGFVLGFVGADSTAISKHFFAIIGMFMALFGGMLLNTLFSRTQQPIVVLWAGIQKFGAVIAVSLGTFTHIFSKTALLVGGFDLLSGIIIIMYWFKMHRK